MKASCRQPFWDNLKLLKSQGDLDVLLAELLRTKASMNALDFHHNFGTTLALQGKHSAARYHLEKSAQALFPEQVTLHNLSIVKKRLGLGKELESSSLYEKSFFIFKGIYPDLFLVFFGLFFLLFTFWYRKRILHKIHVFILSVFILLSIHAVLFLSSKYFKYAVALAPIEIHEGPSVIFSKSAAMPDGARVIVDKRYNDWTRIIAPRSLRGWVKNDYIGIY